MGAMCAFDGRVYLAAAVDGRMMPRVFQISPDTGRVLQEYSLPAPADASPHVVAFAWGMQGLHDRLVVLTDETVPIAVGA